MADTVSVTQADDIRRNIIRQLGDDPHADRVILPGTDWDLVLAALASTQPAPASDEIERLQSALLNGCHIGSCQRHRSCRYMPCRSIIRLPELAPAFPREEQLARALEQVGLLQTALVECVAIIARHSPVAEQQKFLALLQGKQP